MTNFQTLSFDDEQQLALTANCIESLLTSDDFLGDMLDDEFDLSFAEDGFPVEVSSEDEDSFSSHSNHSSSVEDLFFATSDLDDDGDDAYITDILPSSNDTCRAVSPDPTTPNTASMHKLAECMERTALSRSLVEKYCKSAMNKRKASRRFSMKNRAQQRRRSLLLVKALKDQGMEPKKAMKLVSNVAAAASIGYVDSSIGSFLRKQKTTASTAKVINSQNGNFRSSGLKLSKKKLDFLNNKLRPLKTKQSKFPLPVKKERQGGIASFLRRQQLDISVLEL